MEFDTRHLRLICAIADAGSVTRAAATLSMSQPSLTGQLQRIEHHLGGRLFVRDRLGAVPTPLGEFVLTRARNVLPAMDDLVREATRYAAAGHGRVQIRYGAVPSPLMAGLVQRLGDINSGEVSLCTESSSLVLANLVANHHLEFATLLDFPGLPVRLNRGLQRHVVAVEPAFVLLPIASPLADRTELELADLADAAWVVPPLDDNGLRERLAQLCEEAGFTLRIAHETESGGTRDLVREGLGVGVGQATFRDTPGIKALPLVGSPFRIRHTLVWYRSDRSDRIAEQVKTAAEVSYQEVVQRTPHYLSWLENHSMLKDDHEPVHEVR